MSAPTRLPGLLAPAAEPWIVEVAGWEPDEARDWSAHEYEDLSAR